MGVSGAKKIKAIGGKYLKKGSTEIGSKRKHPCDIIPLFHRDAFKTLNFNEYIKTSVCQLVIYRAKIWICR